VTLAQRYDPFGNPLSSAGSGTSIYSFAGEQRDATGLEYLRARYYAPMQGRFFQHDEWEGDELIPQTLHTYVYGTNNPVSFIDPNGHLACQPGSKYAYLLVPEPPQTGCVEKTGAGGKPLPPPPPPQTQPQIQLQTQVQPLIRQSPFPGQIGGLAEDCPPEEKREPTRRLYHGTTAAAEPSIRAYIDLYIGKQSPDFGQGFYTTASLNDAWRLTDWKGQGAVGAVIVFDVPIAQLNSLNHLVFNSVNRAWEDFVLMNRGIRGVAHNYDWVEGPVAKDWDFNTKTVVALEPFPDEYHQLSIHTETARILFQKSITTILKR
jgi:RHS repeat-associated protein